MDALSASGSGGKGSQLFCLLVGALGQVEQLIATDQNADRNADDNQVTRYYRRDKVDASRVTHTIYPDSNGQPSGDDLVQE